MPARRSDNPIAPVGESVTRLDAREKVTGSAAFADDLQFGPGLLHARAVRSPHPHALIKNVDTSEAKKMAGVKAIVTGADFDGMLGLYLMDRFILCRDRVRYIGDPVAVVAADTVEIAEEAIKKIKVEYEILPAVVDPEDGLKPDAPILHPDLGSYVYPNFIFPEPGTNKANQFKVRKGNIEEGFKQCAAIVERKYRVPHIQHVPIEPHVAVAKWDDEGNITLWASSQSPFAQRNLIAKALHVSQGKIEVIAPYVGGGFGSKAGVSMEALAVAVASKTKGRPVKFLLTREEEFHAAFVRQGLVAYYKMGCDKEGNLLAVDNKYFWDAGAYTEYGVNITRAGGYSSTGPYRVPNVRVDSVCVYTNHPVGGPMRGFGMPEIHVGLEQCMDDLAHEIGMDPVEFRSKNCVKGGDIIVTGMKMHPTGIGECIQKAAKAIDWGHKDAPSAPNKKRGKGMAIMWKAPAMPPNPGSSAEVRFNEDGTVNLSIGGQELGQGTFTVMAQMVASALGVPYEWIRISTPINTKYSPYEWQTVASRLTWSMGNAVRNASLDARKQVIDLVAKAWNENPDDLDIRNGVVVSYKTEETMPLKDIVIYGIPKENDSGWLGGPIVGRGNFMPTYVTGLDKETGQGERAVVHYTTGCQAIELEVNLDTGQLEIIKGVSAFDVGKAINPEMVKAQMEGGFVQGMSTGFFEALRLKDGELRNPSFVDYRIATSSDAPRKLESIIVEVAQDDGPWGARGVGEHSMVPTVPAIANAVYDAVGIRVGDPPFTAEKVYMAMLDAGIVK